MSPPTASIRLEDCVALLRGEDVPWDGLRAEPGAILAALTEHDLIGLIQKRIGNSRHTDWPQDIRKELARRAHAESGRELLRGREIRAVLAALAGDGIRPVLIKGTPLAYSLYDAPSSRLRCDTDLLVPREHVDAARRTLIGIGYRERSQCDGEFLFRQFVLEKQDPLGVPHVLDVHWNISTQSMFSNVLSYEELSQEAVPLVALGPHARAAGPVHALLLACIHPVMHHGNAERLIWIYDIHLLVAQLSPEDVRRFVGLARAKRVGAVAARGLGLARARFHASISDHTLAELASAAANEPSAVYLQPGRRWFDELTSNLLGLPNWRNRFAFLREVLFPDRHYMWNCYGLTGARLAGVLLPVLYVHRAMRGVCKVVGGRK
jgi:hypothetical protein